MRIIVLGKGYLGAEFERQGYEVLGKELFQLEYPVSFQDSYFSLSYYNSILDSYDVIINCIGKSNTRWCEKRENFSEALYVNGILPATLSLYCKYTNKKFVQVSTGCLYDQHYIDNKETDFIAAHCNYTVTKWVGEQGCDVNRDLILRPRLYFSDIPNRNNLLCKLPHFKQFIDENNSLTCTTEIIKATQALLDNKQVGIFNIANDGYTTIWRIACLIGLRGEQMSENALHEKEKLFLINNTMDISKLKKFYQPQNLKEAILECWKKLGENK